MWFTRKWHEAEWLWVLSTQSRSCFWRWIRALSEADVDLFHTCDPSRWHFPPPPQSVIPAFLMYKTEVCREHVDTSHRCRERIRVWKAQNQKGPTPERPIPERPNIIVIKFIEGKYDDDLMLCYFYIIIYISIHCISVSWLTLFSSDTWVH